METAVCGRGYGGRVRLGALERSLVPGSGLAGGRARDRAAPRTTSWPDRTRSTRTGRPPADQPSSARASSPSAVDLDVAAWPQRSQRSAHLADQDLEMMVGVRDLDLLGRRGLEEEPAAQRRSRPERERQRGRQRQGHKIDQHERHAEAERLRERIPEAQDQADDRANPDEPARGDEHLDDQQQEPEDQEDDGQNRMLIRLSFPGG